MSPRTGGKRSSKPGAPVPLALAQTTLTQCEGQGHTWGSVMVQRSANVTGGTRVSISWSHGGCETHGEEGTLRRGPTGEEGTHTPGEGVSRLCPASPLGQLAYPGLGLLRGLSCLPVPERGPGEPSLGLRSPLQTDPGVPGKTDKQGSSKREQDTHCKCLKVMSGKPVALDPEGERQSAST